MSCGGAGHRGPADGLLTSWSYPGELIHTALMSAAPDSAPERCVEPAVPRSVRYPQILLAVQGFLWGVVAVVGIVALAVNARGIISGHGAPPHGTTAFVVDVALLTVAAGMSALSALLVTGLVDRRTRARAAAIGLEIFMACLGVLVVVRGLTANAVGVVLTGGPGAILSSAAIACLLDRPARQFTAADLRP